MYRSVQRWYVLCLLFFNSNIITRIALKLLYSWIYLYHGRTDLHYLWPAAYIYMQMNYLPAGGAVGAGETEVSLVTQHTKQRYWGYISVMSERAKTLLFQTFHARWNENDIQHLLKTVGFLQKYSDIKAPAPGFNFETSSAQPSVLPTCNHSNFSRRDLF